MQINIATGNAVINVAQNTYGVSQAESKESLERQIRVLKNHLAKYPVDDQTRRNFEEEIAELEKELKKLA